MRAIDPPTGAFDEALTPEPVLARPWPLGRLDPLEVTPRPRWPVPAPTDEAAARARFQHAEPYLVGVEEELLLHDTASGDLAWISDAERATLADDARYALELPAGQVEAISSPCRTAAEAVGQIRAARADLGRLLGERYRPIAAGTHPAAALPVAITPGERYRTITEAYSWAARRGLASGMHVHVSVSDPDVAVAVHDALRSYLPLLTAIGANAPILQGQDTGLATVRPKLCDGLPRQGIPPALGSFRRLIDQVAWGARSGTFPDPSMLWWEARLHLRHGTVEVRTPDAQTSIEDAESIAAVIHTLVVSLAERCRAGEELPVHDQVRLEENRWSALRYGINGWIADPDDGACEPVRTRFVRLLRELEPTAERLGAIDAFRHAGTLLVGNGAVRQRTVFQRGGIEALVNWLAEETARV
jgi:carboxylate-amine ligase